MAVRFDQDDIGKRVMLELDPESDPIAKALGVDRIEVYGRVLEVGEDHVKLQVRAPRTVPFRGSSKKVKDYQYSAIKDYRFLEK